MSHWHISKSGLTCRGTNRDIAPGEEFWSRLVEGVDEEGVAALVREDYSPEAWPPEEGTGFCYWKSVRPVEVNLGPRMLDTDTLFDIFRELDPEVSEPRKVNFRYLLALILMRKKMLKEVSGSTLDKLRLTDTADHYDVVIPRMDDDARHLAEEDIGQLIVGLPEPSEESTEESATENAEDAPEAAPSEEPVDSVAEVVETDESHDETPQDKAA